MLSYEIEKAVDRYELPLICAYTGYYKVTAPKELSHRWPEALEQRINNGAAKAIHIPFKKNALLDAMRQFTVHGHTLTNGLNFYTLDAHRKLGCLE